MRVLSLLPLAVAATAFVIPDEQTLNSLSIEQQEPPHSFFDRIPSAEEAWDQLEDTFHKGVGCAKHKLDQAKHTFDDAVDFTFNEAVKFGDNFEDAIAAESWLQSGHYEIDLFDGHHGPPHHGPGGKPPHHRRPHHPPHHHKPNLTVYELIAKSKYTTKLAKLINEYPDLVEALNGTAHNYTVFAPTDKAFEKIPGHHKPSKEIIKSILMYHTSTEFYPAGKILVTRTIPTALKSEDLGGFPQRLATQIGLRGLTVNFYSKIVAANIFGTNGVIHGVDSLLLPPPKIVTILGALPGEFSTLDLALVKTGLDKLFNDSSSHQGGTLFAPSNGAFQKLGPRINGFLFSKYGEKYLKALILYHAADNFTLYSDAYYPPEGQTSVPKSRFHVDLETGLRGKFLSIDVARYGRLVDIRINGFNHVAVMDGIAKDGVIQVVPNVLIPPKTPGAFEETSEDMTVEELKERLEPFVEDYNLEL